ncbi:hypothetical protein QTO34_000424 [Cnephaeus nilssonii]|uniref:DUF4371 domain-containing protein n=1 Tax=Cnephaeus nilssonii TaxID=3371016 RepID=A0AA40IBD8_CNENI|nr:hypothetical protein QTO34_000424 [Eptesicus nilssonii]
MQLTPNRGTAATQATRPQSEEQQSHEQTTPVRGEAAARATRTCARRNGPASNLPLSKERQHQKHPPPSEEQSSNLIISPPPSKEQQLYEQPPPPARGDTTAANSTHQRSCRQWRSSCNHDHPRSTRSPRSHCHPRSSPCTAQHLDQLNKDVIIKRIFELPLSRNIIKDRIMRLNTNVQHQLKRDIRKCKYFSISLDETTDVTSYAQLAIIGRYSDGLTMREELIKLVSVSTSKSGSEICKVVIQTFRDLSIDISKVVSVMTDGAPNMVGKKVRFVKLFTEAIGHPIVPFHCIIHQAGFTT